MDFLESISPLIWIIVGVVIVFILGFIALVSRFLKKIEPGKALIIVAPFSRRKMKVRFSGGFVFPIIHRMEIMDISTKKLEVSRSGQDGLICMDNIRADITVNFYVRINNTEEDVLNVAQSIGVARASEESTLHELFQAKFSEALKTVGKKMEFAELFQERDRFKDAILEVIGTHLGGYSLEDTAIDYLQQTPMTKLDELDIMDSEGIRKITELTSTQSIETNRIQREKEETIKKRDVEARERILELERQQKEAEERQRREIANVTSKENAEIGKVDAEERLRSESARIASDEQIQVADVNRARQVEVAEKNKERTVAVETERVERERQLEATEREKLVALAQIEKEREVENEKKNIQDIIRQRVAVERTVAEEEERTADTRAHAAAEREKRVAILKAEEQAEGQLVKDIKIAEARERAATHTAKERELLAEGERVSAEKIAEAKRILADGVIAEESAPGLATVKVKEADADAIRKVGEAEADSSRMRYGAEADGIRTKGLAEVEVKDKDSDAVRKMGSAEAEALKEKYRAEADGIQSKAKAMQAYDAANREHEEFRLRLEAEKEISFKRIDMQRELAESQAKVISSGLQNAKIDIVGGEGHLFDRIAKAVGDGKVVSSYFDRNETLSGVRDALLQPGEGNLVVRIRKMIEAAGLTSTSLRNLSVARLLDKLSGETKDGGTKSELAGLKQLVASLGLSDLSASTILEADKG